METTTTTTQNPSGRHAAVSALAIVGFIALIIIGIVLAIYTARDLPKAGSKLGAAVSLSSIFHHNDSPSLQVVTATSSLPFGQTSDATATTSLPSTVAAPVATTSSVKSTTKHTSTATQTKYITVTKTTTIQPYGNPDLTVTITDVGYLQTKNDTNSFIASNNVPSNKDGAVKFTVTNVGTNVTGSWKFQANVPGDNFTSPSQQSLNPGDTMDFILGFTNTHRKSDQLITVTVDPTHKITESDENNNESSETINLN